MSDQFGNDIVGFPTRRLICCLLHPKTSNDALCCQTSTKVYLSDSLYPVDLVRAYFIESEHI